MNNTDNKKPQEADRKMLKFNFPLIARAGKIRLDNKARIKLFISMGDLYLSTTLGAVIGWGLKRQPLPEEERKPIREGYKEIIEDVRQAGRSLLRASKTLENTPGFIRKSASASLEEQKTTVCQEVCRGIETEKEQNLMLPCALGFREYAHIFMGVAVILRQRACNFESEFRAAKGRIGYPAFNTFGERLLDVYEKAGGIISYTIDPYTDDSSQRSTSDAGAFILELTNQIAPMLRQEALPPPSTLQNHIIEIIKCYLRKRKKSS